MLLARFTAAGSKAGEAPDQAPAITTATLTWFPFALRQRELIAPFGGLAFPENLLI